MPTFQLAWRTRNGTGPITDRLADMRGSRIQREFYLHSGPPSDDIRLSVSDPNLRVRLDDTELSLRFTAQPGLLHYFRLADGTLIPLSPEYEPAHHKLVPGRMQGPLLQFSAGDAYIAVSPGACRVTDSPALARFLHLRDYFNAEKLAEALLAHIVELSDADELPEDVTVLVVEAR